MENMNEITRFRAPEDLINERCFRSFKFKDKSSFNSPVLML